METETIQIITIIILIILVLGLSIALTICAIKLKNSVPKEEKTVETKPTEEKKTV